MKNLMDFFINDHYKILHTLFKNQTIVDKTLYIKLTQEEISTISGFSKTKTNQIINDLLKNGFIENYKQKRGFYQLTNKGKEIIVYVNNNSNLSIEKIKKSYSFLLNETIKEKQQIINNVEVKNV